MCALSLTPKVNFYADYKKAYPKKCRRYENLRSINSHIYIHQLQCDSWPQSAYRMVNFLIFFSGTKTIWGYIANSVDKT